MKKIVNYIRRILARLILWSLNNEKILTTDNCVSVGVDFHQLGRSWAVINIDGRRTHVLKFIDMDRRSAQEITHFLRQFEKLENINIDADPFTEGYIRDSYFTTKNNGSHCPSCNH